MALDEDAMMFNTRVLTNLSMAHVGNQVCWLQKKVLGRLRLDSIFSMSSDAFAAYRAMARSTLDPWLVPPNRGFHQHTWPFQLQETPAGNDPFFKAGGKTRHILSKKTHAANIWNTHCY